MFDERADQVVGLVLRAPPFQHAECARVPAALLKLPLQLFGSGLAIGLVVRIDLRTKRRRQAFIEQHRDVLGIDLLHEVAEKAAVAVQRVDGIAVAIDHVVGHRIVRAEDVHTCIYQILHCGEYSWLLSQVRVREVAREK